MATTDEYEYVNEEAISKILQCTICKSPLIDPVKTKCKPKEHTFCQHCINDWLSYNSSCPSCRQNINMQDLTPITDATLLDMLNELPVQCLVCKKTGIERGNFDVHIKKQCEKQNVACFSADIKCPWTGSHKQLEEHLTTCPYTTLRPMLTQIMSDERQLKEQVKEQQSLIDRLQKENRKFKEQLEQPKRPMPVPPTERRPPRDGTRPRENTAKSSMPNNEPSSSPKVSCSNCSDCWRGAVRGSYFRGQAGGGLQLGSTLLPCDCQCHR